MLLEGKPIKASHNNQGQEMKYQVEFMVHNYPENILTSIEIKSNTLNNAQSCVECVIESQHRYAGGRIDLIESKSKAVVATGEGVYGEYTWTNT